MILAGQRPAFKNTEGAGKLVLPGKGKSFRGSVTVAHGQTIDIPLNVCGEGPNTLEAALWWPESLAQAHNNINLILLDPAGTVRASSSSIPSVFERARVGGPLTAPANWKLRIRGVNVPTGTQLVYWSAFFKTTGLICHFEP